MNKVDVTESLMVIDEEEPSHPFSSTHNQLGDLMTFNGDIIVGPHGYTGVSFQSTAGVFPTSALHFARAEG